MPFGPPEPKLHIFSRLLESRVNILTLNRLVCHVALTAITSATTVRFQKKSANTSFTSFSRNHTVFSSVGGLSVGSSPIGCSSGPSDVSISLWIRTIIKRIVRA